MSDTTPTPASIAEQVASATDRIRGTVADPGFPKDTPVESMTPVQAASYWKYHSRQHELRGRRWDDVEQVRARLAELDPSAAQQHAEQPQFESPDPPEAEVENEAWRAQQTEMNELRRTAIRGELAAASSRSAADLDIVMRAIEPSTFLDEDGRVDGVKVAAFAELMGKTAPPPSTQSWAARGNDPIAAAMAHIGNADNPDSQVGQAVKRLGG